MFRKLINFSIRQLAKASLVFGMLLTSVYWLCFHQTDLPLFPSQNTYHYFYNDFLDGGNSRIVDTLESDSTLGIHFILKKGFITPYVGVSLNQSQEIDITAYNQVWVEIKGENISQLLIHFVANEPEVRDQKHRLAKRHFGQQLELVPNQHTYCLDIDQFKTPEWWYQAVGQLPDEFSNSVCAKFKNMAVATRFYSPKEETQGFKIKSVFFRKDNSRVIFTLILLQCLFSSVGLGVWYYQKKKPTAKQVTIAYKAVEYKTPSAHEHLHLAYIHQHFTDPDLSLKQVAKSTGENARNISDSISEQFGCNFKTYINQIRINEAKRLLKESGLSISEIAYKVGFNSPSSFNRVFKSMVEKSPSEFAQE
jgi:AraC-like DNA-binding protein